eukprot:scaffold112074_cov41-Tisochrysis_lutea.AAC.2
MHGGVCAAARIQHQRARGRRATPILGRALAPGVAPSHPRTLRSGTLQATPTNACPSVWRPSPITRCIRVRGLPPCKCCGVYDILAHDLHIACIRILAPSLALAVALLVFRVRSGGVRQRAKCVAVIDHLQRTIRTSKEAN